LAAAPAIIAATLWPDPKVEQSIFDTTDPEAIWEQVLGTCPQAVDCFAFRVSIGALFGLQLRDGSRVALKIHTSAYSPDYLAAAQAVQQHLWRRGFPCPRPLGGRGCATLEEWRDEGVYGDAHVPQVRRALAAALARLIKLTDELRPLPRLQRGFAFRRRVSELWPTPHNVLFDFEATSANHVRFEGTEPCVAYDWDSLETDREPNLLGCAGATFTYSEQLPVELQPSVKETRAFVEDYEAARGAPLTADELRAARAAAVYVRAYATRCGHAVGGAIDRAAVEAYADALL
jgi:hypothetical protein